MLWHGDHRSALTVVLVIGPIQPPAPAVIKSLVADLLKESRLLHAFLVLSPQEPGVFHAYSEALIERLNLQAQAATRR